MTEYTDRMTAERNAADALVDLDLELAQSVLDAVVNEGLENLPIVKSVAVLATLGANVRDRILCRKIQAFLDPLREVPADQRQLMIAKLQHDPMYGPRVGERLIEMLDRVESRRKPQMLGMAFAALADGRIDIAMLHRLASAIDRLPTNEIDLVRPFRDAGAGQYRANMDAETKMALVNAGLAIAESYAGGLGYLPTKTCESFLNIALDLQSSDQGHRCGENGDPIKV